VKGRDKMVVNYALVFRARGRALQGDEESTQGAEGARLQYLRGSRPICAPGEMVKFLFSNIQEVNGVLWCKWDRNNTRTTRPPLGCHGENSPSIIE
jgi:hypothetical protein